MKPGSVIPALLAALVLLGAEPALRAEVVTVMAANLTTAGQVYGDQAVRIFRALRPDVVLIQEFNVQTSRRAFVDAAFGTGYYFYCEPENGGLPNGIVSRFAIQTCGEWNDDNIPNRDFAWAVIDLPGETDLQALSVHLKAGDKARDAERRRLEAERIKGYAARHFRADLYTVVGGDLNAQHRLDPALAVLRTFLSPDAHVPRDLRGNVNTNASRAKPYDWVIPNRLLDLRHAPLFVGATRQFYPDGIVFDSRSFTPLSAVPPVRPGDSGENGMQHMAVMKAFLLGGTGAAAGGGRR